MNANDDTVGNASERTPYYRIPVSTYRLQLHRDFTFDDARALVPYLARLGVTDCYCSPITKANPGSTHGYDVSDHSQLNPELGGAAAFEQFVGALQAHAMGHIVDFVPNHMAIDAANNPWWRDVLENGRRSRYARFFDIDWEPVKPELVSQVLLPILDDQYGRVLERGDIRLAFARGVFVIRYFDHVVPVNPRSVVAVLQHRLEVLQRELGEDDPHLREYLSIVTELSHLPSSTEADPVRVAEVDREKTVAQERLARLVDRAPQVRAHIEENVRAFNGRPEEPSSFDELHALLEAQPYRLASWRTASDEINYRRFFDINGLAALRMEDADVFAGTHALIVQLIRSGTVTGLRLDHIDGLYDPAEYLVRLQCAVRDGDVTAVSMGPVTVPSLYVVVEKILSNGEWLPAHWPVNGTTGYEFLNDVNGLFVDPSHGARLQRIYRRFTARRDRFADVLYTCKKLVTQSTMASELNVLAHALNRISEDDRATRDFTLNNLREVLQEVVACFPVYRSYVNRSGWIRGDERLIDQALAAARRRNPTMESSIFAFVRQALLPGAGGVSPGALDRRVDFALKFQQYTGPVQAKGLEDTAFYRFVPLLSVNEVGGSGERFGQSPAEFHAANQRRCEHAPLSMLASATHDTKRGEDVRARLNILSEMPDQWGRQIAAWARINARHRRVIDGGYAPDRNDEYLFFQTLVGIWPAAPTGSQSASDASAALVPRLTEYMLKAGREAKEQTSWLNQNAAYEGAVTGFVERTLTGRTHSNFLAAFLPFQRRVAELGMVNSLAQLVLKLASPGVPDFYQGTELWDLSLVDPDNRRPVDYALRTRLLEQLNPLLGAPADTRVAEITRMLQDWNDGRIKLYVTTSGLRLRRARPDLFLRGSYEPLELRGTRAAHAVAFARRYEEQILVAIVPRCITPLLAPDAFLPLGEASWGDTYVVLPPDLPSPEFNDPFTGLRHTPTREGDRASFIVADVLRICPVSLLLSGGVEPIFSAP